MLIKSFLKSS